MKKLASLIILLAALAASGDDRTFTSESQLRSITGDDSIRHATRLGEDGRVILATEMPDATATDAEGNDAVREVRSAVFTGGAVTFSGVTVASNASLASPAVLCSNAHIVAFWPQCFANAATSITFTVELSPDGSAWHRNDDLVYVADAGAAETNRFISVSADGAAAARVVISSPVIVTLTTNRMAYTIKQ